MTVGHLCGEPINVNGTAPDTGEVLYFTAGLDNGNNAGFLITRLLKNYFC